MRGETRKAFPSWSWSVIPLPAWKLPLKRFEPGVSRPMKRSSTVLANVGVALCRSSVGSIPRRTQPAPGAPPTHTGV